MRTNYDRLIRVIACPTEEQILEATYGGRTYLNQGEEVELRHAGEDGEYYNLNCFGHAMFIDPFLNFHFSDYQDWYTDEFMDSPFPAAEIYALPH